MSDIMSGRSSRRGFIATAVAMIAAKPLTSLLQAVGVPAGSAVASVDSVSPYHCLDRNEAAFTEAMVNVLCPADHLTPDGVTCGLATFVDRLLSTGPTTETSRYKTGLAAANAACQRRFGVRFDGLAAGDAAVFMDDMFAGRLDPEAPLGSWVHEVVNPVLRQACFAGPIYDGYDNRVFWKVFGHAGASSVA